MSEILEVNENTNELGEIKKKRNEFIEALNTYHKLQNEYKESIQNLKKNIINTKLSVKEKQREIKKLKPKCINCKRPVGSIFSRKIENKEENTADKSRHLIAMCGDRTNPCPLQIDIDLGYFINLKEDVFIDEKQISEYKKKIILDKNDLLFGYITSQEAVTRFDILKKDLTETMNNYEYFLLLLNKIVDNPERKATVIKLEEEIHNGIGSIKEMMNQFDKTGNHKFVVETVDTYSKDLLPKLRDLMKKKYVYSSVEYNEGDMKFYLVQKKYSDELLEFDIDEPKVLSMKVGNEKIKQKSKPKFIKEQEEEFNLEGGAQTTKDNSMVNFSQLKIAFNTEENSDSDDNKSVVPLEEEEYDSD